MANENRWKLDKSWWPMTKVSKHTQKRQQLMSYFTVSCFMSFSLLLPIVNCVSPFPIKFQALSINIFSSIWEAFSNIRNEWGTAHMVTAECAHEKALSCCRKSLVMRLEEFIIILISLLSSRRWCQLTQALEKKELIRRWRWSVIFIVREINEKVIFIVIF
jgi:hypothetical protein